MNVYTNYSIHLLKCNVYESILKRHRIELLFERRIVT